MGSGKDGGGNAGGKAGEHPGKMTLQSKLSKGMKTES